MLVKTNWYYLVMANLSNKCCHFPRFRWYHVSSHKSFVERLWLCYDYRKKSSVFNLPPILLAFDQETECSLPRPPLRTTRIYLFIRSSFFPPRSHYYLWRATIFIWQWGFDSEKWLLLIWCCRALTLIFFMKTKIVPPFRFPLSRHILDHFRAFIVT